MGDNNFIKLFMDKFDTFIESLISAIDELLVNKLLLYKYCILIPETLS